MALTDIVKAYDIRGTVPDQFDSAIAHALGVAFGEFADAPVVYVARDMRPSGVELVAAFTEGLQRLGVDVVDLGLASTDLLYFVSGVRQAPGAMFTASHNPAKYNGIKLCLAGARPVGADSGLAEIRDRAQAVLEGAVPVPTARSGSRREENLIGAFADHVVSFIDPTALKPMRIVADTANGMGGLVVPAVFERLAQVELEVMYGELDGTFPNHPADPLQPENQRDLQARVVAGGFDLGLAFDGDADRVFLVDELGRGLSGSVTTAILAAAMLRRNPGSTILHNLICSRTVPEVVRERGGSPVRTKVGHSFIKQIMADTGAVFGGEHSAHYYFRENFRADSGIIASVLVLAELSRAEVAMSQLRQPYERYAASGEINTAVDDPSAVIERVARIYERFPADRLDGLTVDCGTWWFNLRPSNTEPLLRLNLEAEQRDECDRRVAEVLLVLTGG